MSVSMVWNEINHIITLTYTAEWTWYEARRCYDQILQILNTHTQLITVISDLTQTSFFPSVGFIDLIKHYNERFERLAVRAPVLLIVVLRPNTLEHMLNAAFKLYNSPRVHCVFVHSLEDAQACIQQHH